MIIKFCFQILTQELTSRQQFLLQRSLYVRFLYHFSWASKAGEGRWRWGRVQRIPKLWSDYSLVIAFFKQFFLTLEYLYLDTSFFLTFT